MAFLFETSNYNNHAEKHALSFNTMRKEITFQMEIDNLYKQKEKMSLLYSVVICTFSIKIDSLINQRNEMFFLIKKREGKTTTIQTMVFSFYISPSRQCSISNYCYDNSFAHYSASITDTKPLEALFTALRFQLISLAGRLVYYEKIFLLKSLFSFCKGFIKHYRAKTSKPRMHLILKVIYRQLDYFWIEIQLTWC